MTVEVKHDTAAHKFYAIVEGQEGYLSYKVVDTKTLNYKSTFVPPSLRGRGIANELAKVALDYARSHDYKIIPGCSFVQSYIEHKPEYAGLVKEASA